MKRILFNEAWDVILLKIVVCTNSYVPELGISQQEFLKTLQVFFGNSPKSQLYAVATPIWKTLYDRFKKNVSDHRADVRKIQAASVVSEY